MSFYEFDDLLQLELPTTEPLIENVLMARDKVLLFANPKVGKSVLSEQAAACLAGGHPFLGFKVAGPQHVLYISAEGDVDEVQENGRHMNKVLPVGKNKLWYWMLPEEPLNTRKGFELLCEQADRIKGQIGSYPALTIFDPAYALMVGSLSKDESVGPLLRNLNRYQEYTEGGSLLIVHHTHRAKRTPTGEIVVEGDDSFMGTFLWKAWPKTVFLLGMRADKYRVLTCDTHRRKSMFPEEGLLLTMVEPDPLCYEVKEEGVTPVVATVRALLRLAPMSVTELERATEKSHGAVTEAVQYWNTKGMLEVQETARAAKFKWRGEV